MVRALLAAVLLLAWAIWLGTLVCLLFCVTALFTTDRETAAVAVPILFTTVDRYLLLVAGVTLLAAFTWRLANPSLAINAAFTIFALATVCAVINTALLLPRMEHLRHLGQTQSPDFTRLHDCASLTFGIQLLLLIAAAAVLPHLKKGTSLISPLAAAPAREA